MSKFDEAITKIKDLEGWIFITFENTRERSLVITKLQEARLWMQELKIHNAK